MSRLLARKGKRSVARPNQLRYIKQISLSVVALLLVLLGLEGRRLSHSAAARSPSTSLQTSRIHCLSWRQTLSCSPYGYVTLTFCPYPRFHSYTVTTDLTAGNYKETFLAQGKSQEGLGIVNALGAGLSGGDSVSTLICDWLCKQTHIILILMYA